ncbi:hypothetical protein U1Q18_034844 [Sarracenia purpurea var. burkii]
MEDGRGYPEDCGGMDGGKGWHRKTAGDVDLRCGDDRTVMEERRWSLHNGDGGAWTTATLTAVKVGALTRDEKQGREERCNRRGEEDGAGGRTQVGALTTPVFGAGGTEPVGLVEHRQGRNKRR